MTATLANAPVRDRSLRAPLTGLGTLIAFFLRRDRIRLPAWIAGLGLYIFYIGSALPAIAPDREALESMVTLFAEPVGRMFTGPAFGMDAPSYECFFASGYAPYLFILAALMNIFLITRHTRAEEQSGRAELIRSNVTGRYAPLTASLVVAVISNFLAGTAVSLVSVAVNFPVAGSVLVGAGTALTGLAFAGIAAVTAQLSEFSRTASGLAGIVLGASFVLRAMGDMAAVGGSALSWVSPLGWPAQTAPYVLNRWAPLALSLLLVLVTVTAAYVLQSRRDFGASLIAVRPGSARAQPSLGSPFGLAVRIQRTSFFGWGAGLIALGLVDGAFMQALLDAGEDMPAALQEILGSEELVSGYLAFLGLFISVLITAYTLSAMQTARGEELQGRADLVLATPVSRTSWLGSHAAAVAVGAILMNLAVGVGTGIAAGVVTGQASLIGDSIAAHAGLLPAILVLLALWMVLFGYAPRLLAPVGWAVIGFVAVLAIFSDLLDLPRWLVQFSPFAYLAALPQESFNFTPVTILLALAALGGVAGLLGIRQREINVT